MKSSGVASCVSARPPVADVAETTYEGTPIAETSYENHTINLFCLAEVYEPRGILCGCPLCLAKEGLTAVFQVEDFQQGVYPLGWWRKSVCSEKLALLVKERICPGWPGGVDDGHRMKGPVFIPKG